MNEEKIKELEKELKIGSMYLTQLRPSGRLIGLKFSI